MTRWTATWLLVAAALVAALAGVASGQALACTDGLPSFRSPDGVYAVCWEADLDAGTITFTMSANVTGWLSVGIGAMHTMADADMYTAWIGTDGAVVVLDTFGTGHGRPQEDTAMGGTHDAFNVTGTLVRRASRREVPRACGIWTVAGQP